MHDEGMRPYADRREAGIVLSGLLQAAGLADPIVLALPRGGVPVGAEIAQALGAPLDVIVVRKIGVPGHREVAMGAVATVAGTIETVSNEDLLEALARLGRSREEFDEAAGRERLELERRDALYRGGREPLDMVGRTAIVVDDGVATGASMRAAVAALRLVEPARVVVAVPVCLRGATEVVLDIADDLICPWTPNDLMAVGQAYRRFEQTSDKKVQAILGDGSSPNR